VGWLAFRSGVIAAVAFGFLMLLLRLAGLQSLPELVFERLRTLLGGQAVSSIIDTFQGVAKRGTLLVMVLVQTLVVGGLLGLLYNRLFGTDSRAVPAKDSYPAQAFSEGRLWRNALAFGGAIWLVVMGVVVPLLGWGFFGSETFSGLPLFPLFSLPLYLSYGIVLTFLFHISLQNRIASRLYQTAPALAPNPQRRVLLQRAAYVAGAFVVGWGAWRYVAGGPVTSGPVGEVAEVTATDQFYKISKNFLDPVVDSRSWILTVDGLVDKPYSLDLAAVKGLPAAAQYVTLSCISNPVGGDLTGNAQWRGVRLLDLLDKAQVQSGATEVILHASDGYTDSITLDTARHDYNLLAYEMNGEPLRPDHGAPLRLLVPGIYGMKNIKWITRIELANSDYKGYWQSQGWDDTARVKVNSRLTTPADRSSQPLGPIILGGTASAGDRSISKVEVSLDGGANWQAAEVKKPLSMFSWVIWRYQWQAVAGRYKVLVRATDGAGELQTATLAEPYPSGSSGYHSIEVKVG